MERSSEAYDAAVAQVLAKEEETLRRHVLEVLATGTTTIREPRGTFQMTLTRPRWRSGELSTEGHRVDGGTFRSWTPVPRSDFDSRGNEVLYRLAEGVALLREG